eukprot:g44109.t1
MTFKRHLVGYMNKKGLEGYGPNAGKWDHFNVGYLVSMDELDQKVVSMLYDSLSKILYPTEHPGEALLHLFQCYHILLVERRNFLRDPPAGVQFNFDFDQMYPVAVVMLQEDELLNRMRFDLVPKLGKNPTPEGSVKEEVFWRNYFYRVSLIKQSAQLTALAAQQQTVDQEDREDSSPNDVHLTETTRSKTPPFPIQTQAKSCEEEEEISTSPGTTEFISDAYDASSLNQEDLRKEIEQLVLDKKEDVAKE